MKSMYKAAAAAVTVMLCAGAAFSAVIADPTSVKISNPSQGVSINLTSSGKALPASAIRGYAFNVDNHTYEFMVKMDKRDGGVTITPTERAEVGTYDLTIKTTQGDVHVTVDMTMKEGEDTNAARANAAGVPIEQVDRPVGRETVTISAPGPYKAGDVLRLETPCPANRTYTWSVNGKAVKQGKGPEVFAYTFPEAGSYVVTYKDFEDGKPKATGTFTVSVSSK